MSALHEEAYVRDTLSYKLYRSHYKTNCQFNEKNIFLDQRYVLYGSGVFATAKAK